MKLERARPAGAASPDPLPEEGRFEQMGGDGKDPSVPAPRPGAPSIPSSSTDRFRPAAERPLEVAEDRPGAQPFTRCFTCETDNTVHATHCSHCGVELDTPAQRAFNEKFWARRQAESEAERRAAADIQKAREEQAVEQARMKREVAIEMARRERDRLDAELPDGPFGQGPVARPGAERPACDPPDDPRHRLAHRRGLPGHRRPDPPHPLRPGPAAGARHAAARRGHRALLARPSPLPEVVMSQNASVVVVVQGVALLIQVIAELGAEYRKEKQMRAADGTTHDVDYVVTDGKAEVGVKVDPKTEKATLIPRDCDAGPGKALAGRIAQRWAYSKAVGELKRKGYAVAKEEKQADGSVRVVMQRWR